MIETSQLQTLVAVARAKSFSKAAEELHVTQSAISQSIKNLETKIGVKLFKRSGKRVVLTPEGEKLYGLGANFIMQLDDTLDEIQFDKDTMSGKVRIGTLTGIGKSWLAPLCLNFAKKHENLTINLNLGFGEDLVRDFENYRLDFLILPEDSLPSIGEKILIGEEQSSLVYPDSDEFKLHPKMTLEELTSYPTILFEEEGDHLYLKWCKEKYGKTPKKINSKYVINSHGNMLQAVQRGLGVAVVPKHVLRRSYYKDKVVTLEEDFQVSNGKFYLVYHKNSEQLLRIKTTLEELTSVENPFR
ncbi:MAG: LysR family transcriptional regulator [Bacteriovoracaceae bacterium]|nr:LysR family transcriptional regulator [Bacteriovoracaceae bacterium]